MIDVLPETTPEGYYILFGKVLEQKADNFNLAKVIRMMDMICSICIYELGPAEGAVVVFDAKGFTMGHLAKFNLFIMKISLDHLQASVIFFMNDNIFGNFRKERRSESKGYT